MKTKMLIIGGGWVGCHLAYSFRNDFDVVIFEKEKSLFTKTSYINQNRLHLGYHYSRNYSTRNLCYDTFDMFLEKYGFLTKTIHNNLYCIPHDSFIDFRTYLQIFNHFDLNHDQYNKCQFNNIEGCIVTNERNIDFVGAHNFFNSELAENTIFNTDIDEKTIKNLAKDYDFVVNCSNNHLSLDTDAVFFEPAIMMLYRKRKTLPFGAVTFVDGPFPSIYPYADDIFTVTDVEHTPLGQYHTVDEANLAIKNMSNDDIENKKLSIEKKIQKYYPEFLQDFEYKDYLMSMKTKFISTSSNRYPKITKQNNIINCFTGKIQGIFIIEKFIRDCIQL
jgi:hypothetical protein